MNADSVAQTHDNDSADVPNGTDAHLIEQRLTALTERAEKIEQSQPTAADIRAEGDARHAEFLDGIRRDILAASTDEARAHHQERLIRVLEKDVALVTEQRDRAETEAERDRDAERRTWQQFMDAWKGWVTAEQARAVLQRKVDKREWLNWPAIFACIWAVAFGVYMVASVLVGGA